MCRCSSGAKWGLPLTASQTDATRAGFHVARSLSTPVLPAIHIRLCFDDLVYTQCRDKLGSRVSGIASGPTTYASRASPVPTFRRPTPNAHRTKIEGRRHGRANLRPQLGVVDLSEPLKRTASAVSMQPLAALFDRQVSFLQLDQTPLPGRLDCSRHPGTHPGIGPGGNNERSKAEPKGGARDPKANRARQTSVRPHQTNWPQPRECSHCADQTGPAAAPQGGGANQTRLGEPTRCRSFSKPGPAKRQPAAPKASPTKCRPDCLTKRTSPATCRAWANPNQAAPDERRLNQASPEKGKSAEPVQPSAGPAKPPEPGATACTQQAGTGRTLTMPHAFVKPAQRSHRPTPQDQPTAAPAKRPRPRRCTQQREHRHDQTIPESCGSPATRCPVRPTQTSGTRTSDPPPDHSHRQTPAGSAHQTGPAGRQPDGSTQPKPGPFSKAQDRRPPTKPGSTKPAPVPANPAQQQPSPLPRPNLPSQMSQRPHPPSNPAPQSNQPASPAKAPDQATPVAPPSPARQTHAMPGSLCQGQPRSQPAGLANPTARAKRRRRRGRLSRREGRCRSLEQNQHTTQPAGSIDQTAPAKRRRGDYLHQTRHGKSRATHARRGGPDRRRSDSSPNQIHEGISAAAQTGSGNCAGCWPKRAELRKRPSHGPKRARPRGH